MHLLMFYKHKVNVYIADGDSMCAPDWCRELCRPKQIDNIVGAIQ